ncbi:energy-coupling factor transport system permease protein [Acetoanaerobium pronyense]|uniref:Energy-coupling factor transport system permease protein n=1 Tax=Acetoanaerobium pronyense TaxID=1482736 RepID=A0ABS4KGU9_9FIRM|nr:energy-coupling factor transporter transmembrane component T [Acetoanaerobium pronyense]MBP2026580.1 energy-coupling factor transport system permease protein [Acetoanaerobium pronyense]
MKFNPKSALALLFALLFSMLYYQDPRAVIILNLFLIGFFFVFKEKEKFKEVLLFSLFSSLIIIIINPLVNQGGNTELFKITGIPIIGRIRVTLEAIIFGLVMSMKLFGMMMIFSIYGFLVDKDDSFSFFSRLAGKSALTVSMSIHVIHRLKKDVIRIKDVMELRGVKFNETSLRGKIKAYTPLLKVILISSLEGALIRAEALSSRGFSSSIKRTSYSEISINKRDYVLFFMSVIILINMFLFREMSSYNFY